MTLPIYLKNKKDTKNLYSLLMGTWLVTDEAESSIKLPFLGNFTQLQTKPVLITVKLAPSYPTPSCLLLLSQFSWSLSLSNTVYTSPLFVYWFICLTPLIVVNCTSGRELLSGVLIYLRHLTHCLGIVSIQSVFAA